MLQTNRWLQDSVPPISYAISIAYTDTRERHRPGQVASSDSYRYSSLSWMTMPFRFVNYSQANIYALKNYSPILYRIIGSNKSPDTYIFDSYENVNLPKNSDQLEKYLEVMKKSSKGRVY